MVVALDRNQVIPKVVVGTSERIKKRWHHGVRFQKTADSPHSSPSSNPTIIDAESIFGTTDFTQLGMEDKMDLMMGGMLKLFSVFNTKFNTIDDTLYDRKNEVLPKVDDCVK